MRKNIVPMVLVICCLIVAFWLVMARRSTRPFQAFDLTAADFAGFQAAMPGWRVRAIPVSTNDPAEPNILVFEAVGGAGRMPAGAVHGPATVLIRLVHGYNMPMCMKIKDYSVALIRDARAPAGVEPGQESPFPVQIWRVTSSSGHESIWATTMLRAGDFAPTATDIRSMAFPRVDIPDDPRWAPQGFEWGDIRHPVASLEQWLRARWNASRTDPLTFLRLRQPAWASEELLTYVTRNVTPDVRPETEAAIVDAVLEAHAALWVRLQAWKVRDAP